jgi:hypothetical protein
MAVRFHLDDGTDLGLSVSHEQARALLVVIGLDETEPSDAVGLAQGPFHGKFKPKWVLSRLRMFRRAMVQGRIREFTTPDLPRDTLIRCVLALEALSERADRLDIPLAFSEVTP